MTELRQRQPRQEDPAYLAYVRTLPCLVCAKPGPNDPAHLRAPCLLYGKRYTGKGEKPDDCWAVPLCRHDHMMQHRKNELDWWASVGIADPFKVAITLYAGRPDKHPYRPRKKLKTITRKPRGQRKPIPASRPLESRSTFSTKREKQHTATRKLKSKFEAEI